MTISNEIKDFVYTFGAFKKMGDDEEWRKQSAEIAKGNQAISERRQALAEEQQDWRERSGAGLPSWQRAYQMGEGEPNAPAGGAVPGGDRTIDPHSFAGSSAINPKLVTNQHKQFAADILRDAKAKGMNPYTWLGIAAKEGLMRKDPLASNWDVNGPSVGPFQLHSPKGVGADYGIKPGSRDWNAQRNAALDYGSKHGTSAWMSVKNAGGEAAITAYGRQLARQLGLEAQAAQGYALGGEVDEPELEDNPVEEQAEAPVQVASNEAVPSMGQIAGYRPAAPQGPRESVTSRIDKRVAGMHKADPHAENELGQAVGAGLDYLKQAFGLNSGTPNAQGAARVLSNEGGLNPQDIVTLQKTIDPDNAMPPALRAAQTARRLWDGYNKMGDPSKASKVAGQFVQYYGKEAMRYGFLADEALQNGDLGGAAKAAAFAYNQAPNGREMTIDKVDAKGNGHYSIKNVYSGEVVEEGKFDPNKLKTFVDQAKKGALYYQEMERVASGGKKMSADERGAEAEKAFASKYKRGAVTAESPADFTETLDPEAAEAFRAVPPARRHTYVDPYNRARAEAIAKGKETADQRRAKREEEQTGAANAAIDELAMRKKAADAKTDNQEIDERHQREYGEAYQKFQKTGKAGAAAYRERKAMEEDYPAPEAVPPAKPAPGPFSNFPDGSIVVNKKTGQRAVIRNGRPSPIETGAQ